MEKIKTINLIQKELMELSNGNPGALSFLIEMMKNENLIYAAILFKKLETCTTIVGEDLYVLWSDLCTKNPFLVSKLCENCPDNILIDACSRQDYSGRELIKQYLI